MRATWDKRQTRHAAGSSYEDLRVESAVLSYVAAHGGDELTIPQLVRDLIPELGEEETGTALERAIRELVRARILCCEGGFVRAAL